jgi:hypothetical protein
MRTPPFHRRILPWIFAISFVAMAPAVVFYTSGYRFDPKKGQVERNGTIIIDSTPKGATIEIDGRVYKEVTPVTLQDVTPGSHHFKITKDGYRSWEKNLTIQAEYVTFANQIHLLRNTQAALLAEAPEQQLFSAPDEQTVLAVEHATTSKLLIHSMNGSEILQTKTILFTSPTVAMDSAWSENGRFALLMERSFPERTWLIDAQAERPLELLPTGSYRWNENLLEGTDGSRQLSLRLPNGQWYEEPFEELFIDRWETHRLRKTSATDRGLVYVSADRPLEGFVLPTGNWTFWAVTPTNIMLRDGTNWLSLLLNDDTPDYHRARGRLTAELVQKKIITELLVSNNEVWSWDRRTEPELLFRLSEPILKASWHEDGQDIYFATSKDLFSLNLDPRDGRILTKLDSFDEISDFTPVNGFLLVNAKRGDTHGLWSIRVD